MKAKHWAILITTGLLALGALLCFFILRPKSNHVIEDFMHSYYTLETNARYESYLDILAEHSVRSGSMSALSDEGMRLTQDFFRPFFTVDGLQRFCSSRLFLLPDRTAYEKDAVISLVSMNVLSQTPGTSGGTRNYVVDVSYTVAQNSDGARTTETRTWYLGTVLSAECECIDTFRIPGEY